MTQLNARFAPADSHLGDCQVGIDALEEYSVARERGKSHIEAEIMAANVLQRAGYNVNAKGGVSIDYNPECVTYGGRLVEYSSIVNLMDDEIREEINSSWDDAGENEAEQHQRFLDEYAKRHAEKFNAEFVFN